MKSRISIEIDFSNGNQPVIQILREFSPDVRDKLITNFLEKLNSGSSWCKIQWSEEETIEPYSRIYITPIPVEQLFWEAKLMLEKHSEMVDNK